MILLFRDPWATSRQKSQRDISKLAGVSGFVLSSLCYPAYTPDLQQHTSSPGLRDHRSTSGIAGLFGGVPWQHYVPLSNPFPSCTEIPEFPNCLTSAPQYQTIVPEVDRLPFQASAYSVCDPINCMLGATVRWCKERKMLIPVPLILIHIASDHLKECSIEPLNLSIWGKVIRSSRSFCDLQKPTNILK